MNDGEAKLSLQMIEHRGDWRRMLSMRYVYIWALRALTMLENGTAYTLLRHRERAKGGEGEDLNGTASCLMT